MRLKLDAQEPNDTEPDDAPAMTVAEAGRRGGQKTRDKMKADDPDYYKRIGKLGGNTTKTVHGFKHYHKIGKEGGLKNKAIHPPEYFSELGKQGGAELRRLIQKGRASDDQAE